MNGTPRRRAVGSFPSTPLNTDGRRGHNGTPSSGIKPLPNAGAATIPPSNAEPLIPLSAVDAPQQRLLALGAWVCLVLYRLYDFYNLTQEDTESFWLFLKWVGIDATYLLYALPSLRIPWLEWSNSTSLFVFGLHSFVNVLLMFRIGLPLQAWIFGVSKILYDRELAISERYAKPQDIVNNPSLILGKQIVHILPEGSAFLNPGEESFCLGESKSQVFLPIQINQTEPIYMELLRVDVDSPYNETITISQSTTRKMVKEALREQKRNGETGPAIVRFPVKKTGRYTLQKITDKSELQVRARFNEVMVVPCPKAGFKPTPRDRCKSELSNIALEVEGTPPLRIKYRKMVNNDESETYLQSIQPDDYVSPLRPHDSGPLVLSGTVDATWARSRKIVVPINETLTRSAHWNYYLDEVQDALGNTVSYTEAVDHSERQKPKSSHLVQELQVHERPSIMLKGCDTQKPIQVAKGKKAILPIKYSSTGKKEITDSPHIIEYSFTATEDLLSSGEQNGRTAKRSTVTLKTTKSNLEIEKSGLYTLESVKTNFCEGEVLEPASCLLHNPPQPELSITASNITDKCGGRVVGLNVKLDLAGTPPFMVKYREEKRGNSRHKIITEPIDLTHKSIDLVPESAGHYRYVFEEVSDSVYQAQPLNGLVLEADVKPAPSAYFVDAHYTKDSCIDGEVPFKVRLQGEGPWTLSYTLAHGNKRQQKVIEGIDTDDYEITTQPLRNGGEYTLTLTSVTDSQNCQAMLDHQAKIKVRHERPKAYFGHIDGRRDIRTLEGKAIDLPLRFTGEPPFFLRYKNVEAEGPDREATIPSNNGHITVQEPGTYELLSVSDRGCPGIIDVKQNRFEISSIPRPAMSVSESSTVTVTNGNYFKEEVCEGDEDSLELKLSGTPQFELTYKEVYTPDKGSKAVSGEKKVSVPLHVASIRMETSKAGLYEYQFTGLSDHNYDHDPKKHKMLSVQQRVNHRPSASFKSPGKTYSYCTREQEGEEVIPVSFTGVPPFYLEVEVRRVGVNKPETIAFKDIGQHDYDLRIPHSRLHRGNSNVSIRKIRDGRGCQAKPDIATSPRVQISVHDAPTISPDEDRTDYCVGDRLSFTVDGVSPFNVYYTFNGMTRKAASHGSTFRRLAQEPGVFTITGVQDSASDCRANVALEKIIHEMPTARISGGKDLVVDIHEGGEAELVFHFTGSPPFEFTYTRSTEGKKPVVLETRHLVSPDYTYRTVARLGGVYEVTAVKDRWCRSWKPGAEGAKGQKLLQY